MTEGPGPGVEEDAGATDGRGKVSLGTVTVEVASPGVIEVDDTPHGTGRVSVGVAMVEVVSPGEVDVGESLDELLPESVSGGRVTVCESYVDVVSTEVTKEVCPV